MNRPGHEVAIVGMSGRFPGASNLEEFWQNLTDGVDCVVDTTDADLRRIRLDPRRLHPDFVRRAGILADADMFDAEFFDCTPREAEFLDPQHRILLEVAHETLEHAGCEPEAFPGRIGVFAGCHHSEYQRFVLPPQEIADGNQLLRDWQIQISNDRGTLATRIAFKLNLHGPAISIQTSCSTSLVAVHFACQSLRTGDSDLALAGGVCRLLQAGYVFNEGMIFSPDGRTRTFDENSAGTLFTSGAGMVALKRLDDALESGDTIHAVILGTAVNNDGSRKDALIAPSPEGQYDVILRALAAAGVDADSIGYVEAHGTATEIGDVTEIEALTRAHGDRSRPCAIGSVKTNIGHTVEAAGVAGLIKVVQMLERGRLVPSLHFRNPNPKIDFANSPFEVQTKYEPWETDGPRRAAVNSFGIGGTNAHVIVEQPPAVAPTEVSGGCRPDVFCLSAKSELAWGALRDRYLAHLTHTDDSIRDICYTANTGRRHLEHRRALIVDSRESLKQELEGAAISDAARHDGPPAICLLFPGQGAQYVGMARELYQSQPSFRSQIDHADEVLRPDLSPSLLCALTEGNWIEQTAWAQPCLFAVEVALAELWRSWGVTPNWLLGHSVGEYSAACFAGAMSFEDGLKLVTARGRLMQEMARGGMITVLAAESDVLEAIGDHARSVTIAAYNAPGAITISGPEDRLSSVIEALESRGHCYRRLTVSRAFHSPMLEPILEAYHEIAAGFRYEEPTTPVVSNLTGDLLGRIDATYWCQHARNAVRFETSMQKVHALGANTFLEVGPHPTLSASGRRCLPRGGVQFLETLHRDRSDERQSLCTLGRLYELGTDVDWVAFYRHSRRRRVPLPTYPFKRDVHGPAAVLRAVASLKEEPRDHVPGGARLDTPTRPTASRVLGHRLSAPRGPIEFENRWSTSEIPYLAEHRIYDSILFPATGFLDVGASAGAEVLGGGPCVLEDLVVREALPFPEGKEHIIRTVVHRDDVESQVQFEIFSLDDAEGSVPWRLHATGTIDSRIPAPTHSHSDLAASRVRCQESVSIEAFYASRDRRGLRLGPIFRGIDELWCGDLEAVGRIRVPPSPGEGYRIHPAMMDMCIQVCDAAFPGGPGKMPGTDVHLPVMWERIHFHRSLPDSVWVHAITRETKGVDDDVIVSDLTVYGEDGEVLLEGFGGVAKRARRSLLENSSAPTSPLHSVHWQQLPPVEGARSGGEQQRFGIFADETGVGEEIAKALATEDASCLSVRPEKCFRGEGDAFFLDVEDPEQLDRLVEGLKPHAVGMEWIYLLGLDVARRPSTPGMRGEHRRCLGGVLNLVQALDRAGQSDARIWLVTRGVHELDGLPSAISVSSSALWGLGRVLGEEMPQLRCHLIDLDPLRDEAEVEQLLGEIRLDGDERQVLLRAGERYGGRLVPRSVGGSGSELATLPELSVLVPPSSGVLEELRHESRPRRVPGAGEVEIEVRAAGLNFRDVLTALGRLSGSLGQECSGVVVRCGAEVEDLRPGDAVMAVARETFASYVTVDARAVVEKPPHLSFEAAATIPIAFLTACHALHRLAGIRSGERVLIHAATGGVGLAAVQLARNAGAQVLATASARKRPYLREIGVTEVMDSRTLDFATETLRATDGAGVDVILNSLAGEFIPKGISALASGGRFVEIGATDIWSAEQVAAVRPDVSYYSFQLGALLESEPERFHSMLKEIAQQLATGALVPLPRSCFPIEEPKDAFRRMAKARHIGKIVLSHRHEEQESGAPESGTVLVTGGLGALGLEVARWLGERGTRSVVLAGRRPPTQDADRVISEIREGGTLVEVMRVDVSDQEQVERLLARIARDLPPLEGIIHAAGVLDDGAFVTQSWARFERVLAPKVSGAWNLHRATQRLPLKFFILFSSATSVCGTPGQSNYAAANAFLDGLAHYRRSLGLPGLSINWGPWADIGMAAERNGCESGVALVPLVPEEGIRILDRLLGSEEAQVAVLPWIRSVESAARGLSSNPRVEPSRRGQPGGPLGGSGSDVRERLKAMDSTASEELLVAQIRHEASVVLGGDLLSLTGKDVSLQNVGLDSLMAIELRNRLFQVVGVSLPMVTFLSETTLAQIGRQLLDALLESSPGFEEGEL